MSIDGDDEHERYDGGGMPEEELSAIEYSHSAGLVLMENDAWLTEEDAIAAVGAEEVAHLRAVTGEFLERTRARVDNEES